MNVAIYQEPLNQIARNIKSFEPISLKFIKNTLQCLFIKSLPWPQEKCD
jgi:hypothetical protein